MKTDGTKGAYKEDLIEWCQEGYENIWPASRGYTGYEQMEKGNQCSNQLSQV